MNKLNKSIVNKVERPVKVLQFGEGNFLRAFVQWIFQKANDQGLINANTAVVQPLEFGRVKDLEEQDGLYTLYLEGLQNNQVVSEKMVIDQLDDFINPYSEYDRYLDYAKSEDLRLIISNTTEAGIVLEKDDTNFEKCPNSFPGKLLALLKKRYDHFQGAMDKGLIIMPCELIDHNGRELEKVILELAKECKFDDQFMNWLSKANTFCSTLVDRIVTGYPRNEIEKITNDLGYIDHSIVKGEIFHLWVIEAGEEVQKEFPLDKAGLNVLFVDDLTPYKERKVRILNGAHTAMVPVAYLYGLDTVKDTVEDEIVGEYVKQFIFNEIVPTLDLPEDELNQFANDVLERFKNPFIRHELLSISLNATTKFKTRLFSSILTYIDRNKALPKQLLFALASNLVFFKGDRDGQSIPLQDNKEFLDMYNELWSKYDGSYESVEAIVSEYLGLESHWEVNLNSYEGLTAYVANCVYSIVQSGMKQAIKEVI